MEDGAIEHIASEFAKGCLAMRIRAIGRALTAEYDESFKAHGIAVTASQCNLLVAICLNQPVQAGAIGAALHMEKSTVSRNLKLMERNGWIAFGGAEGDGRKRDISITPEGAAFLKEVHRPWKEAQERVAERLGEPAVAAVMGMFNGLVRKK